MKEFNFIGYYLDTGNNVNVISEVKEEADSLSCLDIQNAIIGSDKYAPEILGPGNVPAYYQPVDCDFVTLTNTGIVYFMNPDNMQLTQSIAVSIPKDISGFNEEDIRFFYLMEFIIILIAIYLFIFYRIINKFKNLVNKF